MAEIAEEYRISAENLAKQAEFDLDPKVLADRFRFTPEQAEEVADRLHVGTGRRIGWTLYVIADYYLPTVLMIYVLFSGLVVAAAMGFTFAALHRNRELTAMVAGGVSLYRVAAPVLVAGFILTSLVLPLQELAIPPLVDKLLRPKSNLKYGQVQTKAIYFTPGDKGSLLSAASFEVNPETGEATLRGVSVLERGEDQTTLERRLQAPRAVWDRNTQAWKFNPPAEVAEPGAARAGPTVEGMDVSAKYAETFSTDLSPTVLLARQAALYLRLLSLATLRDLQDNQAVDASMQAEVTRIIWSRVSVVALGMLILVIGLPFFLMRGPGMLVKQSLLASGACVGAWAGGVIAMQVGSDTLPPLLGAWLPVILNLPFAAAALSSIKT